MGGPLTPATRPTTAEALFASWTILTDQFLRYGVPPHGGFGMGLGRVLMLLLHLQNIREATYLFRGPTRLLP